MTRLLHNWRRIFITSVFLFIITIGLFFPSYFLQVPGEESSKNHRSTRTTEPTYNIQEISKEDILPDKNDIPLLNLSNTTNTQDGIEILYPVQGSWVTKSFFLIGRVDGPLFNLQYRINKQPWVSWSQSPVFGQFEFEIEVKDIPSLSPLHIELKGQGIDGELVQKSTRVFLDSLAPTISFSQSKLIVCGNGPIYFDIIDDSEVIERITVNLGKQTFPVKPVGTSRYFIEMDTALLDGGFAALSVHSMDKAGNFATAYCLLYIDNLETHALVDDILTLGYEPVSWYLDPTCSTCGFPSSIPQTVYSAPDPIPPGDPPFLNVTSPVNGSIITQSDIVIQAGASDDIGIVQVQFYVNDTLIATDTTAPYSATWQVDSNDPNGWYYIRVIALDAESQTTEQIVWIYLWDLPPIASIIEPANGTLVSVASLLINATIYDDVGIDYVNFYGDGQYLGQKTAAPYTLYWDLSDVYAGWHVVSIFVMDTSERVTHDLHIFEVAVDQQPQVTIISPSNGSTITGPTLSVSVSATDPEQGIYRVYLYVDDVYVTYDSVPPYAFSYAIPGTFERGMHTITVYAQDVRGNRNGTTSTFYWQAPAPTVAITSPAPDTVLTSTTSVTISATASDEVGIYRLYFYVDGTYLGYDASPPYQVVWSITASISDGPHIISVQAQDTTGRKAWDYRRIFVSKSPPTTQITNPSNGSTVSGIVNIQATASSSVSINRVYFYADGVQLGYDTVAPYSYSWDTSTTVSGYHIIMAKTQDAWGLWSYDMVIINVSSGLPSTSALPLVALSHIQNGSTVNGSLLQLSVRCVDDIGISALRIMLDGHPIYSTSTPPYAYTYTFGSSQLGWHDVHILAIDTDGQVNWTTRTIQVVNQNPQITLLNPLDGSLYDTSVIPVLVNASDDEGINSVLFFIDGQYITADSAAPYYYLWQFSTPDSQGLHSIAVLARDTMGYYSSLQNITITIDDPPPIVEMISPEANTVFSGSAALLVANASDNFGISKVIFMASSVYLYADTQAPYEYLWIPANPFFLGKQTVFAIAYDSAGQIAVSTPVTFYFENQLPDGIAFANPAQNETEVRGSFTIVALASDDVGVTSLRFLIDGVTQYIDAQAPFYWTWITTSSKNGWYELTLVALDGFGNRHICQSRWVYVNNTIIPGPVVTITSPSTGYRTSSTDISMSFTGTVDYYEVRSDLGLWINVGTSTSYLFTSLSDGPHVLQVRGVSGSISGPVASVIVFVDTTLPVISLLALTNISTTEITFEAIVAELYGISQVQFFVNESLFATDTTLPYIATWYTGVSHEAGLYEIKAIAYDLVGNQAIKIIYFTLTVIPPQIQFLTPTDGAVLAGSTIPIILACHDDIGVRRVYFYVNGTSLGYDTAAPWVIQWFPTLSTYPNGVYRLSAIAFDYGDIQSSEVSIHIVISDSPPVASITFPVNGSSFYPGRYLIIANVSDNVGIYRVSFYMDGAYLGYDSTPPYSYSWTIGSYLSVGWHTVQIRVQDNTYRETIVNSMIYVEEDPYGLKAIIDTPTEGQTISAMSFLIRANCTSASGIYRVYFYVDGANIGYDATYPYTYTYSVPDYWSNGEHLVSVVAHDQTGVQRSDSVIINFQDNTPSITITSPLHDESLNNPDYVSITTSVSDDVGIYRVYFYVDGIYLGYDSSAPYEYTWNLDRTVAPGAHYLTARAFDYNGRQSFNSIRIHIIEDYPIVTITNPLNDTTVSGSISISALASDLTGVYRVYFYIDNTYLGYDASSPYAYPWTTTSYTNGWHLITVYAQDLNGHQGGAQVWVNVTGGLTSVGSRPIVNILYPLNDTIIINQKTLDLRVNATDDWGVTEVTFLIDQQVIGTYSVQPFHCVWSRNHVFEGWHLLGVIARDAHGNMAYNQSWFYLNESAPFLEILDPVNNTLSDYDIFCVANSTSQIGIDSVIFMWDGIPVVDTTPPYQSHNTFDSLSNGQRFLRVIARDTIGQISQTNLTFTILNSVPKIWLQDLLNLSTIGGWIQLQANYTDNRNLASISFVIDGAARSTKTQEPFVYSWDTSSWENRSHEIILVGKDTAGQTVVSDRYIFFIDNRWLDPFISITSPTEGLIVSGSSVTMSYTASPLPDYFEVRVDDGTWINNFQQLNYQFTNLKDGIHKLQVRGIISGAPGTVYHRNILVDTKAPSITLIAPTDISTTYILFNVNASDPCSGIRWIRLYINGTYIGEDTSPTYHFYWDTSSAHPNGIYEIRAIARDWANHETETILYFTYQDPTPKVVILNPTHGSTVIDSRILFQIAASDDIGIYRIYGYLNGSSLGYDQLAPYEFEWTSSSSYPNGWYNFSVHAYDFGGRRTEAFSMFYLEDKPPQINFASPANNTVFATESSWTLLVNAQDDIGIYRVYWYINDSYLGYDATPNYSYLWTITTEGTFVLRALAIDTGGRSTETTIVVYVVDEKPFVEILSPAHHQTVYIGTLSISVNATDNRYIDRVYFYIDGEYLGYDSSGTPFYDYNWIVSEIHQNGWHLITVRARDSFGKYSYDQIVVYVQNNPPQVMLTSPLNGSLYDNVHTVPLAASVVEDVGMYRCYFYYDGVYITYDQTSPYEATWTLGSHVANGWHRLTVKAIDSSGRVGFDSKYVNVTIQFPFINITSPVNATEIAAATLITVDATDVAGMDRVRFYVDSYYITYDNSFPYSWSFNPASYCKGWHIIQAVAYNINGLTNTTQIFVNVTAGTTPPSTPPTIEISSSANGTQVSGNQVTVSATANDDIGISQVRFLLDGMTYYDSDPPYQVTWSINHPHGVGNHTVFVSALDTSGWIAFTSFSFEMQDYDPTIQFVGLTNGSIVTNTEIVLTASAQDDVGISKVDFLLNGVLLTSDSNAPYQYIWNAPNPQHNGTLWFSCIAYDPANHRSPEDTVCIILVDSRPTVNLVSPANNSLLKGMQQLVAGGSDNVGLHSISFIIDGLLVFQDTTAPYEYNWNTLGYEEGNHSVVLLARDNVGWLSFAFCIFGVDNTPPTFTDYSTNLIYPEGTTGHAINWTGSDLNPHLYEITRNGIQLEVDNWETGVPIIIDVDGLSLGTYSYNCILYDKAFNTNSHVINVTVIDITPPVVNIPDDFTYELGSTGNEILWNASDLHPSTYILYRNGTPLDWGGWTSGQNYLLNIDGLAVGVYNYTIIVYDTSLNFAIATVFVTVEDTTPPIWLVPPTNQFAEFGQPFQYDLNATDLSGLDQWWINDTTHFAIDSNGVIVNATFLFIDTYGLQIWVNDTFGNTATVIIAIIVQDTTPPHWLEPLHDVILGPFDVLAYDLNASDLSGLDSWWLNDTIHFSIDANGIITNITNLVTGIYGITVYVNDTYDNTLVGIFAIEVDYMPPSWVEFPTNQINELGTFFRYDLNATDPRGLDVWWLNDTSRFSIDANGIIQNATWLYIGIYWLQVWVNDTLGNIQTATFSVTVQDTTPPHWVVPLETQFIGPNDVVYYDIDASDLSGIDQWWINDTLHFAIDQNGILTNITTLVPAWYAVQVFVNDTFGNTLSGVVLVIVDFTPPTWIEIPTDQVIEYGTYLVYDLNATDPAGLSIWWINDTAHFSIDAEGIIRSTDRWLRIGYYGVEVGVNDSCGNILLGVFRVTVRDSTPPVFTRTPLDQYVEFGDDFEYRLYASDPSGIRYWSLNDSLRFAISSQGVVTNRILLNPGTYGLCVSVEDWFGNIAYAYFDVIVQDTTPPEWITVPSDQTVEEGQLFEYQLEAWDLRGIARWTISDTDHFTISDTGLITSNGILAPGQYTLTVYAYDPSENYCSATFTVTMQGTILPPPPPIPGFPLESILVGLMASLIMLVIIRRRRHKP